MAQEIPRRYGPPKIPKAEAARPVPPIQDQPAGGPSILDRLKEARRAAKETRQEEIDSLEAETEASFPGLTPQQAKDFKSDYGLLEEARLEVGKKSFDPNEPNYFMCPKHGTKISEGKHCVVCGSGITNFNQSQLPESVKALAQRLAFEEAEEEGIPTTAADGDENYHEKWRECEHCNILVAKGLRCPACSRPKKEKSVKREGEKDTPIEENSDPEPSPPREETAELEGRKDKDGWTKVTVEPWKD
jgi:hypothetical protein